MARPRAIVLNDQDRSELERLQRASAAPAGLVRRARAILLIASGLSGVEVAERTGYTSVQVSRIRSRFAAEDALARINTREKNGEPLTPEFVQLKLQIQDTLAGSLQSEAEAISNYNISLANLEKAKAGLVQTKADYDRAVRLTHDGVMSQQQLDLAKANFDSANASVGAAAANVTQGEAQVNQKEAAVTVAQTNLDYTVIRSPIDGTVVARNVDVGQTVAASRTKKSSRL